MKELIAGVEKPTLKKTIETNVAKIDEGERDIYL